MSSKILIVDDSELVLAMASDALKAAGYDVFTATNGIEANSYIYSTTNKPDLIILDIMMPLLDGNKKAKILKQQNHSQDIPIVFISSKSEAELVSLVQEAGADGYICKPFTPQSIVSCVKKLLK
ncbi:MAG: chemotaxis protein CheY [Deltaproteobacteria bacterium]|nr:chemotaxis protein CheY [Deltaproteobacteria bacterium]